MLKVWKLSKTKIFAIALLHQKGDACGGLRLRVFIPLPTACITPPHGEYISWESAPIRWVISTWAFCPAHYQHQQWAAAVCDFVRYRLQPCVYAAGSGEPLESPVQGQVEICEDNSTPLNHSCVEVP
ncbi:hypothetical protein VF12_30580 [Nostoc linckia z15]|nr:hypothetical protein VF12_30580 [Nostoc linckia z15]